MRPQPNLGALLTAAGFAVLVPERRGFGQSSADDTPPGMERVSKHADDVLAALEYAHTLASVDQARIGVMGWSVGGIITMLVAMRGAGLRAAINQSGGPGGPGQAVAPELRTAMYAAARAARAPVMLMSAENDNAGTLALLREIDAAMSVAGLPHELRVYPRYTPPEPTPGTADGHMLFAPRFASGVEIWGGGAVAFFRRHLA